MEIFVLKFQLVYAKTFRHSKSGRDKLQLNLFFLQTNVIIQNFYVILLFYFIKSLIRTSTKISA